MPDQRQASHVEAAVASDGGTKPSEVMNLGAKRHVAVVVVAVLSVVATLAGRGDVRLMAATSQTQTISGVLRVGGQPGKQAMPPDVSDNRGDDIYLNAARGACGSAKVNADGSFALVVTGGGAVAGCYNAGESIVFSLGYGIEVPVNENTPFKPGTTISLNLTAPRFWDRITATVLLDGKPAPDGYRVQYYNPDGGGGFACVEHGPVVSGGKVVFSMPYFVGNANGGCSTPGAVVAFRLRDGGPYLGSVVASALTTYVHTLPGQDYLFTLEFGVPKTWTPPYGAGLPHKLYVVGLSSE